MADPGIGASGIAGLAFEVLAPPVQNTPTASGSGGTLSAGTYRYYITATNAVGETTVSNEQSTTTTGASGSVITSWGTVTNATGYKVYRTAVGGATGTELLLTTLSTPVTSYVDDGSLTPSGAYPTYNTAYSPGTYTAPTKYFPFMSESLVTPQDTVWRRPIRQSADVIGAVDGNFHMEGDLSIEALEDVVLYFLAASRTSVAKSGSTDFTYTITPTAAAVAARTLSITLVRNSIVFGYTGVTVSSFTFNVSDGLLMMDISLMGRDEAVQSTPTPTWPVTTPFGAGMYSVEFPTGTAVTDTDTFEWTVEDNAEPQYRLKDTSRGAEFIKYGERSASMTAERDFLNRTDYDAFKALTAQSVTVSATRSATNAITLLAPVAIKDTYEVTAPGQGDLVRASISYMHIIDSVGKSWQVTILSQEDIAAT